MQSIRIKNTVQIQRNKQSKLVGLEILNKFGSQFPNEPDLEDYTEILYEVTNTLDPHDIVSIFGYIHEGPYSKYFENKAISSWGK